MPPVFARFVSTNGGGQFLSELKFVQVNKTGFKVVTRCLSIVFVFGIKFRNLWTC